jgi:uncharacterized protein
MNLKEVSKMNYDYYDKDDESDDENIFNANIGGGDENTVESLIKSINNLLTDKLLPKSVVTKLTNVVGILSNNKEELALRINKVQEILNEITEDSNLPSFVKTQIWNIASLLEKIDS